VEILRLVCCEKLTCYRNEFIFDAFVYLEPVQRFKNWSDVRRFWCSGDNTRHTSKRVLGVLKSFYLRLWKIIVQ